LAETETVVPLCLVGAFDWGRGLPGLFFMEE
jgi:hypothetical protein